MALRGGRRQDFIRLDNAGALFADCSGAKIFWLLKDSYARKQ